MSALRPGAEPPLRRTTPAYPWMDTPPAPMAPWDGAHPSARSHQFAPAQPVPTQPVSTQPLHTQPAAALPGAEAAEPALYWSGPAAAMPPRAQAPAAEIPRAVSAPAALWSPAPAALWSPSEPVMADTAELPPNAGPAPARRRARDPSPSRLVYRLNRLWLTPLVRRLVTLGLPAALLAGATVALLADQDRRMAIAGLYHDLRSGIENRPEFMVHSMSVHTESPELARAIVDRMAVPFPVSSFHLDLDALRARVEALDAVESAALRIRTGGVLELTATERDPVAVWRHAGGMELLDAEGRRLAVVSDRNVRPDLPLVAGDGAPRAVAEARQLLAAAQPVADRVIGLVRISERRWDLVLTGGQRILLPAQGALPALERVLALHAAQDLLSREVTVVDMRNPARPTIRVSRPAIEALTQVRRLETGGRAR